MRFDFGRTDKMSKMTITIIVGLWFSSDGDSPDVPRFGKTYNT